MKSNHSQSFLLGAFLSCVAVSGFAQEGDCQGFRSQGNTLVLENDFNGLESANMASLIGSAQDSTELLLFDFSSNQLCIAPANEMDMGDSSWAMLSWNEDAEEVAVTGFLDGSYQLPLRLDLSYQSELLVERTVGEDIGLTDMEFLSDNSGVGAEDFFSEEIGFLKIGSMELDSLFAEVPRYGISYEHYSGVNVDSIDESNLTRGSLGMGVLRDYVLVVDPDQSRIALIAP